MTWVIPLRREMTRVSFCKGSFLYFTLAPTKRIGLISWDLVTEKQPHTDLQFYKGEGRKGFGGLVEQRKRTLRRRREYLIPSLTVCLSLCPSISFLPLSFCLHFCFFLSMSVPLFLCVFSSLSLCLSLSVSTCISLCLCLSVRSFCL